MPVLAPGKNVRIEEPVTFEVTSGLVLVTDMENSNQALSEGDTYTSPEKGGITVHCVESARYEEREPRSEEPNEEAKEPTVKELHAKAKKLGLSGYSKLSKAKLSKAIEKAEK